MDKPEERTFAVAPGSKGELLFPNGLEIIDTWLDLETAREHARFLSSTQVRHYRVIELIEVEEVCTPALRVLQGEGLNPMPAETKARLQAKIREDKKAKKEQAQ